MYASVTSEPQAARLACQTRTMTPVALACLRHHFTWNETRGKTRSEMNSASVWEKERDWYHCEQLSFDPSA